MIAATENLVDPASLPGVLEAVLDSVDLGAIVLDAQGRVEFWNRWMEKASHIAAGDAVGRELAALFPELHGGRVLSAVASALQQGFPSILSQSLNKAPFPFFGQVTPGAPPQRIQQRVRILPLRRAGVASHCLVEIQDVSLAVHREKVLNEQKKFLNTILESEPECVLVLAADGEPMQINRAGLDLFEVADVAELKAAGFATFILQEDRAAFNGMCGDVLTGRRGILECKVSGRAGARRWLEIHAAPLLDAQGKTTAVLCVARDTTARKEAEATTRALIDANQESAILLDESGHILAINEVGAHRFGKGADELIGRDFYTFLPTDLASLHKTKAEQVFRGGAPLNFQDARDGIHVDINVYPVFDSAGKVSSISVYTADVTEQLQLQAVDRLFHAIDEQVLQGQPQQSLFEYICREVTSIFGYPFAWIGRKISGGTVTILASGGKEAAYLEAMRTIGVRWDNSPLGQGPAGTAIRSGRVQTFATSDVGFTPWRQAAEAHGLRSQMSIPLILRGEVYGSFTLASRQASGFDNPATVRRLTDIASRICVAIERALDREQMLLLETALSSAANGVFITDNAGRIQWLNSAFETMTGYSREESLGAIPRLLRVSQDEEGFFKDMLDSIATGEAWAGETAEKRKDGTPLSVRQTITPIRNAKGMATHFISILEDITATRQAEANMQRLAHYDYLTGLPNRALFHDRLRHEIARVKRGNDALALMFIDLDRFKAANDTYGHDIGDQLLKGVAQRLSHCVRASDTVARLAGDEFTIILPEAGSNSDIEIVCKKIIAAIAEPFDFDDLKLRTSASVGVAFYPSDAEDETSLVKNADIAMYAAKAEGRNGFKLFHLEMNRR